MSLVVLLRGVNVGGHRTFQPSLLVKQLDNLEMINIGAAGTFVVRKRISQALLRSELARALPFKTEIIICQGRDILGLVSQDPFAGQPVQTDLVRFVSVMSRDPESADPQPMDFPSADDWQVRILETRGRFILGIYRRNMKAIGYLGALERAFGTAVTTRNWNTILAIARVLGKGTT